MNPTTLPMDRLEFVRVSVEANPKFKPAQRGTTPSFSQIEFDCERNARLGQKSRISIDNPEDPRHFVFEFGIKLSSQDESGQEIPYELEVGVRGFFRYVGSLHDGVDRFRAVRVTGYSIMYGAIREMVSTLTGRGPHGLLQLPAMNFHGLAKEEAESDEKARQEALTAKATPKRRKLAAPARKSATKGSPKRSKDD